MAFHIDTVIARLQAALPEGNLRIQSMSGSRPPTIWPLCRPNAQPGSSLALACFMGILVGLVIVYQVLSTDVADHLREYATFKAMGYGQPFFLGIVFEEAIILAVFGFIPGFVVSTGALCGASVSVTGLPVGNGCQSRDPCVFRHTCSVQPVRRDCHAQAGQCRSGGLVLMADGPNHNPWLEPLLRHRRRPQTGDL